MIQQTITDGCSWFPDLWIRECCNAHDMALYSGVEDLQADLEFFVCIVEESTWLGPAAWLLGGLIVAGMVIGRPVYRWFQKGKKDGTIKKVDNSDLNE